MWFSVIQCDSMCLSVVLFQFSCHHPVLVCMLYTCVALFRFNIWNLTYTEFKLNSTGSKLNHTQTHSRTTLFKLH